MYKKKFFSSHTTFEILSFVFLSVVFVANICAQSREIEFNHLTSSDGLSLSAATKIIQDSNGFMWFGTYNGLNRYDGYSFKIYLPDPANPNSISNHSIWSLHQDLEGFIWVGTLDGLNRFDTKTEKFYIYKNDPNNPKSISSNYILDIYEDKSGTLWLATLNGLNKYNRAKDDFSRINLVSDWINPDSLNSVICITEDYQNNLWLGTWNGLTCMKKDGTIVKQFFNESNTSQTFDYRKISAVFEDASNNIWIGTASKGLFKYDIKNDRLIQYSSDENNPNTISHNSITSIFQDKLNNLWVGTRKGLNVFDIKTGKFQRILNNPQKPLSIINNEIYSIYEDRTGLIWVGSAGGIGKHYQSKNEFFNYSEYENNPAKKISSNRVHSLYVDKQKNLWAGTFEGLDKIKPAGQPIIHYRNQPGNKNSLNDSFVMSVMEDHSGIIWAGTSAGGLNRYDPKTGKFNAYKFNINDTHSLSNNGVLSICETHDNILWVGTWWGLNRFDRKSEKFYRYTTSPTNPNGLNHNLIWTIHEDSRGILWLGTDGGGVNRFDPKENSFTYFTNKSSGNHQISDNRIFSIFESKDSVLWLATSNGLNVYDPRTDKIKIYKTENGLPGNAIAAIIEDNKGFIWISTEKGLSKFDRQTGLFSNYTKRNGLYELEFDNNVAAKSEDGTLYFGCRKGLLYFNPDDIKDEYLNANIVFTDLKIYNQSVPISSSSNSILHESVSSAKKINIPFNNDVITIEFALLDYYNVKSNTFSFKLSGFDTKWNEVGSRNSATYTNLPPGDYTFLVKAFNHDGVKKIKEAKLYITILPVFYQTWWFKSGVATLMALLTVLLINGRTNKIKKQNKILEGYVAERTRDLDNTINKLSLEIVERKKAEEKAQKSLEEKEILLKEIHHRVKNNLQVISSLLYLQSSSLKDEEVINHFNDSQDRIKCMALIHEKLYQSKNFSEISFNEYVKSLILELEHSYKRKDFSINTLVEIDDIKLSLDTAMSCGLMINELITNIYKYAFPTEWLQKQTDDFICKVVVKVEKISDNKYSLEILDNGIGIPENLDILNSESLGINLVNSLVNQLNGTIKIENKKGTCFKIVFEDIV